MASSNQRFRTAAKKVVEEIQAKPQRRSVSATSASSLEKVALGRRGPKIYPDPQSCPIEADPESSSTLGRRSLVTGRKALRLDINKIKKNIGKTPLEQENPRSFRDVVKAAMLVRNWMGSTPTLPTQSDTFDPFEPPSIAQDDAPILEEPRDLVPPRPSGWKILKSRIIDIYMWIRYVSFIPSGTFYYYWSLVVFLAVLYNMLGMVIFIFDDVYHNYFWHWLVLNFLADLVYITDILISSRKVYMADGLEVKNSRLMWRNYRTDPAPIVGSFMMRGREMGGRILLDIFCLLPLDVALVFANSVSLLRTIRIIKLHRFMDFIEVTKQRSNFPHGTKIFFLMLACYILFHWNACVYFLFSLAEGLSEEDTNAFGFSYYKVFDPRLPLCKVADEGCLMKEDYEGNMDLDEERPKYVQSLFDFWTNKSEIVALGNFSREYSMSIYWSALTITTCGQQPYPNTSAQNMLEVTDTLIGVLVFATIIGSVGGVVYIMNQDLNNFRLSMDGIKFYMRYRNVTFEIQDRVMKCFMYLNSNHQLTDEKEVVECLPPRMQGTIASDLHMATVEGISLFNGCSKGFLVDIVFRMRQQVFMPNDVLCKVGDKAKEMFIIKSGVLHIIDDNGIYLHEITDGSTYGEMSIIQMKGNAFGDRRQTGLTSVGYSDVYILNQDDVLPLLSEYPEERERLAENARQFLIENEMLEDGADLSALNMESTTIYSLEEQLDQLERMVDSMSVQLDHRYEEFRINANDLKQRMTKLERIMVMCRDDIRKDCIRGNL